MSLHSPRRAMASTGRQRARQVPCTRRPVARRRLRLGVGRPVDGAGRRRWGGVGPAVSHRRRRRLRGRRAGAQGEDGGPAARTGSSGTPARGPGRRRSSRPGGSSIRGRKTRPARAGIPYDLPAGHSCARPGGRCDRVRAGGRRRHRPVPRGWDVSDPGRGRPRRLRQRDALSDHAAHRARAAKDEPSSSFDPVCGPSP